MRLPQLGDIVLYYSTEEKRQLPAIVTNVDVDDKDIAAVSLDLWVFPADNLRTPLYLEEVTQGNEPGQWQWRDIPITKTLET